MTTAEGGALSRRDPRRRAARWDDDFGDRRPYYPVTESIYADGLRRCGCGRWLDAARQPECLCGRSWGLDIRLSDARRALAAESPTGRLCAWCGSAATLSLASARSYGPYRVPVDRDGWNLGDAACEWCAILHCAPRARQRRDESREKTGVVGYWLDGDSMAACWTRLPVPQGNAA